MKPTRFKMTLLVAIIIVAIFGVKMTYHLKKSLPLPKVTIEFQSFEVGKTSVFHLKPDTNDDGQIFFTGESARDWWFRVSSSQTNILSVQTNVTCTLYLTNHGSTRIWWLPLDCQVEARTPYGWITNKFGHFTTIPWSVGPSKQELFSIYVPSDAIEWRVAGSYHYYKRHHMRRELVRWMLDDLGFQSKRPPEMFARILGYSSEAIGWTLGLLPEPQEEFGEVWSKFFTNKPPTILPPLGQPHL